MEKIKLSSEIDIGMTSVSNTFIEKYMPFANGEYVKIYLYLLKTISSKSYISISELADKLNNTENDIKRALKYWSEKNVLTLTINNNEIINITLNNLKAKSFNENHNFTNSDYNENSQTISRFNNSYENIDYSSKNNNNLEYNSENLQHNFKSSHNHSNDYRNSNIIFRNSELLKQMDYQNDIPTYTKSEFEEEKPLYTSKQISLITKQLEVKQLLDKIEKILAIPLTKSDIQNVAYFYENLNLSCDVIEFLYKYCKSIGKLSSNYIEAVAKSWNKQNIVNVEQAMELTNQYKQAYNIVKRNLGIDKLLPAHIELIDKWITKYKISLDLIEEACKRTALNNSTPSIRYLERIVDNWHNENICTVEQANESTIKYHTEKVNEKPNDLNNNTPNPNLYSKNQFHDFPQHQQSKEEIDELQNLLIV